MKHYRATPVRGTPGEPIVARGLPELVKQAKERFGMLASYESVRAKVYLKDAHKVFRCTDDRFVQIDHAPDADEAYDAAQLDEALNNDREADYQGRVYINYKDAGWNPGDDGTEFVSETLRAKGLMNLLHEAQAFVLAKLGAIPPAMSDEEIKRRLPNMRSQMSKSRANENAHYVMPFPTLNEDYWLAPTNWHARVFVAVDAHYEPLPVRKPLVRR